MAHVDLIVRLDTTSTQCQTGVFSVCLHAPSAQLETIAQLVNPTGPLDIDNGDAGLGIIHLLLEGQLGRICNLFPAGDDLVDAPVPDHGPHGGLGHMPQQ